MDILIFVTLGTQDKPFNRLLEALEYQIDLGNIKEEVIVQAGLTKYESAKMKIFNLVSHDEFEKYIKSFFDSVPNLEENIEFFYRNGLIKYKQLTSIKQKLNILRDIIPKYLSVDWNFI